MLTTRQSRGYTNKRIIPRPAPSVHGYNDLMFPPPVPIAVGRRALSLCSLPITQLDVIKRRNDFGSHHLVVAHTKSGLVTLRKGSRSYLNKPLSAHLLPLYCFFFFFCYYLTGLTFISNLCSGQLSGSLKASWLLICV